MGNILGIPKYVNDNLEYFNISTPRIVIVSSMGYAGAKDGINFDDIHFENGNWDRMQSYCISKLANILHAKELAKRLENTGISVYVLHPGT